VVDSDDNVEIPIKTTAMAPPNPRLASINALISIIVLTPFPFCHKKPLSRLQDSAYSSFIPSALHRHIWQQLPDQRENWLNLARIKVASSDSPLQQGERLVS
jgi:hypothetical protein